MLVHLSVRDVVLIDRLDLELGDGLSVLTGETGAGKSILLDALGLALGRRADATLVRKGAERAVVAATFRLFSGHPAVPLLEKMGIEMEEEVVVRRTINSEGRSRAFVNDQAVTVGYLSQLGSLLVEVHGQNDRLGLLDQGAHRGILDLAGDHQGLCASVNGAYHEWMAVKERVNVAREAAAKAQRREDTVREDFSELNAVSPKLGEEKELSELRSFLKESTSIAEALASVQALLGEGEGNAVDMKIGAARRTIHGIANVASGHLDALLESLDRVSIELSETFELAETIGAKLNSDPQRLSEVEERLFLLKRIATKHGVTTDDLVSLQDSLASQLELIISKDTKVEEAEKEAEKTHSRLSTLISRLHEDREQTGRKIDSGVAQEVTNLRMGGVKFRTSVQFLPQEEWTRNGGDRVNFEVSTVPGAELGPIHKVASGGELSRFMLALRVVIAGSAHVKTLVFDEIDAGIGGAVAGSVGQRLARLAGNMQVLVVTHQPQIAVQASHHFRVVRGTKEGSAVTGIERLTSNGCIEEVARMLAGEEITGEARAAARRLLDEAK
jgi:DNA repair protein RecN (Recombination protein N)